MPGLPRLPRPPAGSDFRATALSFQRKCHDVSVKILKALFIGLGWDEALVDEVRERGGWGGGGGRPGGWGGLCENACIPFSRRSRR
jgi:hypothetical protein